MNLESIQFLIMNTISS